MNSRLRLLAMLTATLGVSALSMGQSVLSNSSVTVNSVGAPVKSRALNTLNFNPQIAPPLKNVRIEKEHEFTPTYLPGLPNNLVAGGTFAKSRADFSGSVSFPTIGATGWQPPDPDIAVGPTHIAVVVNSDIAFYSKTGQRTFQQSFGTFFTSVSPMPFIFDPKAFYDADSGRFFVVALSQDDATERSEFLIAVSATSNPNGTWQLFKIDNAATVNGNKLWLDYPGWGFSKTGVVATGNMFPFTTGNVVSQVFGFQKSELLGTSLSPAKLIVSDAFTIQTAKGDKIQTAAYSVANNTQTSTDIFQSTVTGTPGSTTMTVNRATVQVPAWNGYSGRVTGPGGVSVQTNDPRVLTSMVRTLSSGEVRLVATQTVGASALDPRASARWYEFDITGMSGTRRPTLRQSGTIVAPSNHVYSFPAVGINSRGDIGLTFSKVGSTTPGDVMVCGRKAKDPLGAVSVPVVLETSTATQYSGGTRWGDYFDVEIDPINNTTFWAVGMGAAATGSWQTFVKSFVVSLDNADLVGFNPISGGRYQGSVVLGNLASLNNEDGNTFLLASEAVRGSGQIAGVTATYKVAFNGVKPSEVRLVYKIQAPAGSTAIFSIKNRASGAFETYFTTSLTPTASAQTVTFTDANLAKYVSSAGDVDIIVRAIQPLRNGSMPPQINVAFDQLKMLGLAP